MSETSIFGGRILPTLPHHSSSFPSCRPSNGMAHRTRFTPLLWPIGPAQENLGFWLSMVWLWLHQLPYGCYPHLATLTYLKFQLDAHLPLAGEDVDMLETPLQHLWYPWRPFSEPILRSAIQTGPNTWREKCCRLEILWTFRSTSKPCLGVQLYVAIFIYVYNIYINNYIYIYIYISYIYIYISYIYISIYIWL